MKSLGAILFSERTTTEPTGHLLHIPLGLKMRTMEVVLCTSSFLYPRLRIQEELKGPRCQTAELPTRRARERVLSWPADAWRGSQKQIQCVKAKTVSDMSKGTGLSAFAAASLRRSCWLSLVQRGMAVYAAFALALGGFYQYPWQLPGVALRVSYVILHTLTEYVARGFKPLFEEWTLPFELVRAILRCVVANYAPSILRVKNAKWLRAQTDLMGRVLTVLATWQHGIKAESFQYNGLQHICVRRKSATVSSTTKPRRCVVLYYHGGGYAILTPRYYVSSLSDLLVRVEARIKAQDAHANVQVEVLLANYRKTPEYSYPVPPDDALAMYRYLLDVEGVAPSDIILGGDSAGGGLALTTLLRVRENNASELPRAAILSCPYVDLELRGDERKVPYCIVADGAVDTIPRGYVPWGGCPKTWGDASPLHCFLGGLPPVYVITGEFDYILPQAYRLMERAKEDGVDHWQLDVHKHMPHVFMNLPSFVLPQALKGLDAMAAFAASQFMDTKHAYQDKPTEQGSAVAAASF